MCDAWLTANVEIYVFPFVLLLFYFFCFGSRFKSLVNERHTNSFAFFSAVFKIARISFLLRLLFNTIHTKCFLRMVFNYIKYPFLLWRFAVQFFSPCRWSFVATTASLTLSYGWLFFLVLRFLVLLFFLFVSALIHIGGAHKFRQCSALHTQKHSHRPTLFYQFYYITRPCVRWKFICTFGYEAFAFLLLHFSFVFSSFSLTLFADPVAASTSQPSFFSFECRLCL